MNEVNSQTKTKTYWSKTLDSSFNRENVITNLSTLSLKLKFNNLNQKILLGKLEQILLDKDIKLPLTYLTNLAISAVWLSSEVVDNLHAFVTKRNSY